MPVHADWYSKDDAIIIMTFSETWSIEEQENADAKINQLARSTTTRFDLIVDYSGTKPFIPTGTLMNWVLIAAQREEKFPNWGLTVFVLTTIGLETFYEAGRRVSPLIQAHGRRAKSIEEAVQLIVEDRKQSNATRV